ncbi:MAG: hypothetical protein EZS28_025548 [Streblomastix strix]|uniref:Uncharacterized protein n=1 Tax=Streblomastix strix TaxID=222440 RepID=A0A5J4V907_9EUKA|nr:MAG: hypothetical protein EZS28_025548 [Streblomastix strix]
MGFFSKIANFGSKILGGVKHAAQWIAPTLHKVLSTVAGPVGMIHPGIGGALGAGANLAGAVDRLKQNAKKQSYYIQYSKRGGNSGGVYAANNQIIDGQASDFALKIAADDITSLPDSADGDFAFSAESGTVWMYDQNWYNSGDIVPDQVTPASDAVPNVDSGAGVAGISTEYSRGDHQHPLQVSTVLPAKDTAVGEEGTANTYARSDHTHHVNLGNSVPKKDTETGTGGTSNVYSSATHQHPLNIDPTVANVPLVNATAAANGTSDFYSRNDHVHPQQLTYDGNITATKFIKTGGLATEILCANGDTTSIDAKLSRTYNSGAGGWIRLCVFPAGASVGNPFIEFKVYNQYNAVQTIRLVPYYTVNGINTWLVGTPGGDFLNPLGFVIVKAGEQMTANRGLMISADGNTLTFNGRVL